MLLYLLVSTGTAAPDLSEKPQHMSLTGLAFLICYSTGLIAAAVRHPIWGLFTYVAVFYLHPPSRWWGEFLPDLRWSLLAAAVTLISTIRLQSVGSNTFWLRSRGALLFTIFVAYMWIQFPWALNQEFHKEGVVLFTKYLVLFYLIYKLIDTSEKATYLLLAHVIGCFYFGIIGFSAETSGRLEGVGGPGVDDANTLAMQVSTGVICASMLLLGGNKVQKIICLLALPFMLNIVILAGSRGAFLGLVMGGAMLCLFRPVAHKRLFNIFAVFGILAFGYLAHDIFWERMGTIRATVDEQAEIDHSAESRLVLLEAQLQMAGRHPLGAGYRGTTVMSVEYLDLEYLDSDEEEVEIYGARSSHNTVMTVLVDQGIPGIIIFAAMALWCIKISLRLRRFGKQHAGSMAGVQTAAVIAALTTILTSGMFANYLKAEVLIWFIAFLAALEQIYLRNPSTVTSADRATGNRQVPFNHSNPVPATSTRRNDVKEA